MPLLTLWVLRTHDAHTCTNVSSAGKKQLRALPPATAAGYFWMEKSHLLRLGKEDLGQDTPPHSPSSSLAEPKHHRERSQGGMNCLSRVTVSRNNYTLLDTQARPLVTSVVLVILPPGRLRYGELIALRSSRPGWAAHNETLTEN